MLNTYTEHVYSCTLAHTCTRTVAVRTVPGINHSSHSVTANTWTAQFFADQVCHAPTYLDTAVKICKLSKTTDGVRCTSLQQARVLYAYARMLSMCVVLCVFLIA